MQAAEGSAVGKTATLELSPSETERVVAAQLEADQRLLEDQKAAARAQERTVEDINKIVASFSGGESTGYVDAGSRKRTRTSASVGFKIAA